MTSYNSKLIHTDASKTYNGVGLSIIFNNLTTLYKPSRYTSIFIAKSQDIYKATKHNYNNTDNLQTNYIMLSDSINSLKAINNIQNSTHVTKFIQEETYRSAEKGIQIHFI